MEDEKRERIRYFGFAAIVVFCCCSTCRDLEDNPGDRHGGHPNVLAGYASSTLNSALLEKEISADLRLVR